MKFLRRSDSTKSGLFTVFEDPGTGELFAIDDDELETIKLPAHDVLEGVLQWDSKNQIAVLKCPDGEFHAGAIVSMAFEGKKVRVSVQVLGSADTDPVPAGKNYLM